MTAKVIAHERGPKILIGKYRKRTGYKRHTGFRAATSRVEISLGGAKKATPRKAETAPKATRRRRRPSRQPPRPPTITSRACRPATRT